MLAYQLLKNHAGVLLTGDQSSLRRLYEVVHDVNQRSPFIKQNEEYFLGLAYDVRKAYEGRREVIKSNKHFPEIGVRYGVEVLWPVILTQHRTLRASLAFLDHSRWHQAITYNLEAVLEDALNEDFGSKAPEILTSWQRLDPSSLDFHEKMASRGTDYSSWSKALRKRNFSTLLDIF